MFKNHWKLAHLLQPGQLLFITIQLDNIILKVEPWQLNNIMFIPVQFENDKDNEEVKAGVFEYLSPHDKWLLNPWQNLESNIGRASLSEGIFVCDSETFCSRPFPNLVKREWWHQGKVIKSRFTFCSFSAFNFIRSSLNSVLWPSLNLEIRRHYFFCFHLRNKHKHSL